jgi:transcriptional regulator with XRE-family HTH domain
MSEAPTFGDVLERLRRRRGLSQSSVARLVPIDRSALSRWEGGSRLPDLASLARLATAMRLSADELARLVRAAGDGVPLGGHQMPQDER